MDESVEQSDEDKCKRVPPMKPGERGWDAHWQWLAENGNVPEEMDRQEYREMVTDWQEYLELELVWGESGQPQSDRRVQG